MPHHTRLVEPFMGSGSFLLNRKAKYYLGADTNTELVSIFNFLKNDGVSIIDECEKLFNTYDITETRYYELREEYNNTVNLRKRAILFLYLNRNGFQGICRYNRHGKYTTPYGFPRGVDFPRKQLELAVDLMQNATVLNQSFEKTFLMVDSGDMVYCDPPYLPEMDNLAVFTEYSAGNMFAYPEHLALVKFAEACRERCIPVIISNHDSNIARELYQTADDIIELSVHRRINIQKTDKRDAKELLVLYGIKPSSLIEY